VSTLGPGPTSSACGQTGILRSTTPFYYHQLTPIASILFHPLGISRATMRIKPGGSAFRHCQQGAKWRCTRYPKAASRARLFHRDNSSRPALSTNLTTPPSLLQAASPSLLSYGAYLPWCPKVLPNPRAYHKAGEPLSLYYSKKHERTEGYWPGSG